MVYYDNYALLTTPASEVAQVLVGNLSDGSARQVIVIGYGNSPLAGIPPNARSRRVEFRFVVQDVRFFYRSEGTVREILI